MKITIITPDNVSYFRNFISSEDEKFIMEDLKILPIGLVATDLEGGKATAAGAICIRPDDFLLNISSFYISPEYRGRGAGKFLLNEVKRIFGEKDMEFNIEFLIYGKEQEDLANFLEHYGFMFADPEYEEKCNKVMEMVKDLKLDLGKISKGSGNLPALFDEAFFEKQLNEDPNFYENMVNAMNLCIIFEANPDILRIEDYKKSVEAGYQNVTSMKASMQ